ncbi:unnamed protein product [Spirodela intermedia]|uniref:Uncharacterized protein n=1 Tax=Spirodela intermedia TaxID=51605 RepID=A0A7I8JIQ0_SPIIN|nr:unnamed protein product [Spirodela intermedia]CAA6669645.1 unnamed protein product [Spirodela intermedia]
MGNRIVSGDYHLTKRKPTTLQFSCGCHSQRGEVATGLPADRPLPDDGFRLTTGDVEGRRTRAPIDPSKRSSPCSRLLPTALPTRLRARLAGGPPFCNIFILFLVLHLSQN